jgi:hypothetical protein
MLWLPTRALVLQVRANDVPMTYVDRLLQRWRMRKAVTWLPERVRLIDVGAHEGELFKALKARLTEGFGVEPLLRQPIQTETYRILPGFFPAVCPTNTGWDGITLLAVLEHIPREQQQPLAKACHDLLREGGRVIVTVPAPAVDHVLAVLKRLRLIDGMSLEEHYGFKPADVPRIFGPAGFRLIAHRRFQLGLNHLFVFERVGGSSAQAAAGA